MRWRVAFMGLTLILLVLARQAPGLRPGAAQATGPVDGGTLRLSLFSAPRGVFNPILAEESYDGAINGLVFDGLLTIDDRLQWTCNLCASYELSSDNRRVTFRLRPDVQWHDGKPLTTRDVAFTFQSILHPDYTGVRAENYSSLAGVGPMLKQRRALTDQVASGRLSKAEADRRRKADWEAWLRGPGRRAIQVIDQQTIAFAVDEPYAPLLQSLAVGIIPAHLFEGTPMADWDRHPAIRQPVGTGPYKFVRYVTDQYVELVRHETYHRGRPHIPKLIYRIANQDVAIGQLITGELDLVPMRPADVVLIKDDRRIKLSARSDFGYQYLGVNHRSPLFADRRVRQALMYAIDREAMVKQFLQGHGTVINTHMLPTHWAYDGRGLNPYPHDPQKAAALLAQAGWQKNAEGYLMKDGRLFQFTLKYPSGNKVREQSAALIQANLKAVGIKVELQMMEFTTLVRTAFDQQKADAWLMGWGLGLDPHPGLIFAPGNKWGQVSGWSHPEHQALLEQGVRHLQPVERKPIYAKWARILNEELPFLFLYSQNNVDAVRQDRIQGLRPDVRGTLWNIWELWIPREMQ